ncbi:MAG: hypothetical protein KAS49_01995, partial [Candidatus Cloacimonetes bacterium]|nr:hypothetical protein [Candidatus Cloacimonadota bacterium]
IVVGMKNDALLVELHRYPVVGVLNFKDISDSHYSFMPKMMVVLGDKKGEIYHLADEIKVFINRVDDDIYLGLAKE